MSANQPQHEANTCTDHRSFGGGRCERYTGDPLKVGQRAANECSNKPARERPPESRCWWHNLRVPRRAASAPVDAETHFDDVVDGYPLQAQRAAAQPAAAHANTLATRVGQKLQRLLDEGRNGPLNAVRNPPRSGGGWKTDRPPGEGLRRASIR